MSRLRLQASVGTFMNEIEVTSLSTQVIVLFSQLVYDGGFPHIYDQFSRFKGLAIAVDSARRQAFRYRDH